MEYRVNQDGTTENKEEIHIDKSLDQFLIDDVDASLHELIRTNVMTATRNFQHRVEAFRNEVIRTKLKQNILLFLVITLQFFSK